jgi:C-terminal processing protease CtpA/Prc
MPSGRSFDGQGIEPDITIEEAGEGQAVLPARDDPVLQAALKAFRGGEIAGG